MFKLRNGSTKRYTFVPQTTVTDIPSPESNGFEHNAPATGLTVDVHLVNDEPIVILPLQSIDAKKYPSDDADVGRYGHPYVPCRVVVEAVMVA